MFTSALVTLVKTWKQPQCSSVGEPINCGTRRQILNTKKKKKLSFLHEKKWRKQMNITKLKKPI